MIGGGAIVDPLIHEKINLIQEKIGLLSSKDNNPFNGAKINKIKYDSISIVVKLENIKSIDKSIYETVSNLGRNIDFTVIERDIKSNRYIGKIKFSLNSSFFKALYPPSLKIELIEIIIYVLILLTLCILLREHWKNYESPWISLYANLKRLIWSYISRS